MQGLGYKMGRLRPKFSMRQEMVAQENKPTDGPNEAGEGELRRRVSAVKFQSNTLLGKLFDVLLIAAILLSVAAVMLQRIAGMRARHGPVLQTVEWAFTVLLKDEYVVRPWSVRSARIYASSLCGIVDLLAIRSRREPAVSAYARRRVAMRGYVRCSGCCRRVSLELYRVSFRVIKVDRRPLAGSAIA